jgi:hypothetical protein
VEGAGRHPFAAAIEAGDLTALKDTLAPDVALYAAVVRTPFEGREMVAELYSYVFEAFDEIETLEELAGADIHAVFWKGHMGGRYVEGVDRFRVDDAGKVREITIYGRPLSGIAAFMVGIGPRLARPRRGRVVAATVKLTARPLPPLLARLDRISRWMVKAERSPAGELPTAEERDRGAGG